MVMHQNWTLFQKWPKGKKNSFEFQKLAFSSVHGSITEPSMSNFDMMDDDSPGVRCLHSHLKRPKGEKSH